MNARINTLALLLLTPLVDSCSCRRAPRELHWERFRDGFEHASCEAADGGPTYVRRRQLRDGCLFGDFSEVREDLPISTVECGARWRSTGGECSLTCECQPRQLSLQARQCVPEVVPLGGISDLFFDERFASASFRDDSCVKRGGEIELLDGGLVLFTEPGVGEGVRDVRVETDGGEWMLRYVLLGDAGEVAVQTGLKCALP